ncbi:MAG: flagellar M-ring protein FliF [Limnochordaceae bacterium]|nr:flagellar M-ring protein FliF [Limnochordaceae bacterium]
MEVRKAAKQGWQQVEGLWHRLPRLGRAGLGIGLLLILAMPLMLPHWLKPHYAPLFTGLQTSEAAQIVSFLQEKKVPYQLAEGGTAILVPDKQVYDLRLQIAGAGLPGDSVVGFELLNQSNLGLTDFERRARYNWALQGELTRTIEKLDGVEEARVHLVIPEPSVFVRSTPSPSASVFVRLTPGHTLAPEQVRAITTLVSRSVPGLKESDVVVVDQAGQVLTDQLDSALSPVSTNAAAQRYELTRQVESELEQRIRTMLEQAFGLGQTVVRVSATLDFDLREQRAEQFAPVSGSDRGVLRSEQLQDESSTSTDSTNPMAGVPGIASNVPGYAALAASPAGTTSSTKSSSIRNYEVNRTESYFSPAPGTIRRLSVAVLVNQDIPPTLQPQLEAAVASAAGIDRTRGDQLTVVSVPFFNRTVQPQPTAVPSGRPSIWWWVALAATLLGVLLTMGLLIRDVRQRRAVSFGQELAQASSELVKQEMPQVGAERAEEGVTGKAEPAQVLPPEGVTDENPVVLGDEETVRRQLQKVVTRLAQEDPEGFIRTLQVWLSEDEMSGGGRPHPKGGAS